MTMMKLSVTELLALASDALQHDDLTSAERHINDVIHRTEGKTDESQLVLSTLVQHSHQLANLWLATAKRCAKQDKLAYTYGTLRAACLYRQTVTVAKRALHTILFSLHNQSQWTPSGQIAIRNIRDTVDVAGKQLERLQSSLASSIEREVYCDDTSARRQHSWQRLPFDKRILRSDWLYDFKAYINQQMISTDHNPQTNSNSDSVFEETTAVQNPVENGHDTFRSDTNNNKESGNLSLTNDHKTRQEKIEVSENVGKTVSNKTPGHNTARISSPSATNHKLHRSQSDKRHQVPYNKPNSSNSETSMSGEGVSSDNGNTKLSRRSSAAAVTQSCKPSIDLDRLHSNIQALVRQISADTRRLSVRGRPSESLLRTGIEAGLQRICHLNEEEDDGPTHAPNGMTWIERLASNDVHALMSDPAASMGNSAHDKPLPPAETRRKAINLNWPALLTLASDKKHCSKVTRYLPSTFTRGRTGQSADLSRWCAQGMRLNYEYLSPVSTIVSTVAYSDSPAETSVSTLEDESLWLEYVTVLQHMAHTMSTSHADDNSALDVQVAALDCLLHTASAHIAVHLSRIIDIVSDISVTLYSLGDVSGSIQTMEDVITLYTNAEHSASTRVKVARSWLWIGQAYLGKDPSQLLDYLLAMIRKVLNRWEISCIPHTRRSSSRSDSFSRRRSSGAEAIKMSKLDMDSGSECESDDDDDDDVDDEDVDDEEDDEYDVSLHEALTAFQHAASALQSVGKKEDGSNHREVLLTVNMFLADCKMLTNDHVVAMNLYRASVDELEQRPVKELQPLYVHGLVMLATGRFLRHHLTDSAVLLERAEHVQLTSSSSSADCCEESGYAAALMAHVYHLLGQVIVS